MNVSIAICEKERKSVILVNYHAVAVIDYIIPSDAIPTIIDKVKKYIDKNNAVTDCYSPQDSETAKREEEYKRAMERLRTANNAPTRSAAEKRNHPGKRRGSFESLHLQHETL